METDNPSDDHGTRFDGGLWFIADRIPRSEESTCWTALDSTSAAAGSQGIDQSNTVSRVCHFVDWE